MVNVWPLIVTNRLLAVCLASLSSVASCSGEKGIPFEDLEEEALATVCQWQVTCGEMPDEATCRASFQSQPGYYATMQQNIARGRVIYDGALARECLQAFKDIETCSQTEMAALFTAVESACEATFTGTVAVGAPCFLEEECVNSGSCQLPAAGCAAACCQGTCVARPDPDPAPAPTARAGEPCGSSIQCISPAACVPDAADPTVAVGTALASRLGPPPAQIPACRITALGSYLGW